MRMGLWCSGWPNQGSNTELSLTLKFPESTLYTVSPPTFAKFY